MQRTLVIYRLKSEKSLGMEWRPSLTLTITPDGQTSINGLFLIYQPRQKEKYMYSTSCL